MRTLSLAHRCSLLVPALAVLALAGFTSGAAAPSAVGTALEDGIPSSKQKSLSKAVGAWLEARRTRRGINEAYEDLTGAIEKIEKKRGQAPVLSLVDDLSVVFQGAMQPEGRPTKGKVKEITFGGWGGDVTYAVHGPKDYNPKKGAYPVVLCLPEAGQRAQDHLTEDWIDADLRGEVVLVAIEMPGDTSLWGETGSQDEPGGRALVLQVLSDVGRSFLIDRSRVFLAGSGEGAAAACKIAAVSPHQFAGVIGRAGDASEGLAPDNFRNLPTFFSGAGTFATAFEEAAKQAGIENVTVAPDGDEAAVRDWMREQQRDLFPAEVTLVPVDEYATSAYWLGLDRVAAGESRISASVDRDANTIEVTAEGVGSIWVHFNDRLLDLDQPVRVVCNGVAHEEVVPRSLSTALEQLFQNSDPFRVVVFRKKYDLPASE
jgi:poly(3-hydroxybutyrate) depolymerase